MRGSLEGDGQGRENEGNAQADRLPWGRPTVYTTNKHVLRRNSGRRLENLFWRIWSNRARLCRVLSGATVARLFNYIADDQDAIIRTTPVASPRERQRRLNFSVRGPVVGPRGALRLTWDRMWCRDPDDRQTRTCRAHRRLRRRSRREDPWRIRLRR